MKTRRRRTRERRLWNKFFRHARRDLALMDALVRFWLPGKRAGRRAK